MLNILENINHFFQSLKIPFLFLKKNEKKDKKKTRLQSMVSMFVFLDLLYIPT